MTPALETFGCVRLACTLSKAACAKRWRIANRKQKMSMVHNALPKAFDFKPCKDCPVGEVHEKEMGVAR